MLNRTISIFFLLSYVLSSCAAEPTLISDIEDNKSKSLTIVMQKTDFDFDVDAIWEVERIRQGYEIPSADNNWLKESSSRGLTGVINKRQLILINHRLNIYDNDVDWDEPVELNPEEGYHPVSVSFPSLGQSTYYRCYSDSTLIICQIIVQYASMISILNFETIANVLENGRIKFVEHILLSIDGRVTQYE